MTRSDDSQAPPTIAVAIPCYNEAAAVGAVVNQFRAAWPAAEIVVIDNNSTDGTGEAAARHGARVIVEPRQGKGFAVRAAFADLRGRDVVVMVDGDGTYPAEFIGELIAPILEGRAETTVGARRPEPGAGAMSPVRALGNLIIRSAFRLLIGKPSGDLLSGYRAFSRRFVETTALRSEGFEIETELAVATVARRLPAVEISVPYRPRIAGTESKLRAFRDGRRILATILREGLRLAPWRVFGLYIALVAIVCAPLVWSPTVLPFALALAALGLAGLLIVKARLGAREAEGA